jgi:hypothetical protein
MATDLLMRGLEAEPFSWGSGSLDDAETIRARYISALRAADDRQFGALLEFVRS